MHSVQQAAKLTGISPDTLRMWERRYQVVVPARSDAGYRMYDDEALRRLAMMRSLVAAGWPPRLAARQVRSGRPPETGPGSEARHDDLVRLAEDLDPVRLESRLTAVFAGSEFEDLVDEWLMPSLAELGRGWLAGRVSVAGEHFVSAGLQRHLVGVLGRATPPPDAPRVLVGLARASRHELGVLSFAAVLRRAGVEVVYVGSDLPTESWVEAVLAASVSALVLAVPTAEDLPGVRDVVGAVSVAVPDLAIHVGGALQDQVGPPARPLGHTVVPAAQDLAAELLATPRSGRGSPSTAR